MRVIADNAQDVLAHFILRTGRADAATNAPQRAAASGDSRSSRGDYQLASPRS
jgi:hypothetical protein